MDCNLRVVCRSPGGVLADRRPIIATMNRESVVPALITPIEGIVAELARGRMVVLIDEEDRENEGDLVLAAEHVTPEAINFMATHARGLICLTLTGERAAQLGLTPMSPHNGSQTGTNFTISIDAAEGIGAGVSAADRARTVQAACAPGAGPADLVQPGHVFPIVARPGGVLVRAGHTEAGCDLTRLAGLFPAAVICEIMNDDGTMARLPQLLEFCALHNLMIGTIADLIRYRSATESLIRRTGERPIQTAIAEFRLIAFRDETAGASHLALVHGEIDRERPVLVRVHEPVSVLDLLETESTHHAWSVTRAMQEIVREGAGVVLLLNCEAEGGMLNSWLGSIDAKPVPAAGSGREIRMHGVAAQILRDVGVGALRVLGRPRRLPSIAGFGLRVTGYVDHMGGA